MKCPLSTILLSSPKTEIITVAQKEIGYHRYYSCCQTQTYSCIRAHREEEYIIVHALTIVFKV